jgi:acyl-coenzyme A synthetase/AMP-(fatty) acid ligase/3-hydroxymyristoyl/3-hydroxydecanoyl-(acyl carrier protein) dehydratase
MRTRTSESNQITASLVIGTASAKAYPLVNCPSDALEGLVVAYRHGQSISAEQFLRDVHRLASALPEGLHCLNVCQDRYRITVLLGAVMLRQQISLLPPNTAQLTLANLHTQYGQTYFVSDAPGQFPGALDFETLLREAKHLEPAYNPEFSEDQIIGILFTSGSTGNPSPNPRRWGDLCQSARAEADALHLRSFSSAPTVIGTVPAQHSYGIESTVAMCLQNGFALSADASFFPADILAALANVPRPRVLVTTPYHLKLLVETIAQLRSPEEAPAVDVIVSATAPLSPQLASTAEKLFQCPVREIFGSTESGQIAARRTTETECWTLFPGTVLTTRGDQTWASGGHVGQEKLLNDVIDVLPNHQFRLLGRTGDMVNLAGKRTSLGNLNFHLNSIAGVDDGLFFMPDDHEEAVISRLQAVAVSQSLTSNDILSALRQRIDPVFLPRSIRLVNQIPRNSTGKVTREILSGIVPKSPANSIHFPVGHPATLGHFDTRPIVPGVTLLASVIREITKTHPEFSQKPYEITSAKFLHPVEPPADLTITLNRKAPNTNQQIDISFEGHVQVNGAPVVALKGAIRFAN